MAVLFIILILASAGQRKLVLSGALSALPFSLLGFLFTEVWEPSYITGGHFGLEDMLFCFFAGGISLAFVAMILHVRKLPDRNLIFWRRRGYLPSVVGAILMTSLFVLNIRNYLNACLSMFLTAVFIMLLDRTSWKIFFSGSVIFVLFYWIALDVALFFWPDILNLWKTHNLSGIRVGRVPGEDLLWAFLFGGTWPLFYLFSTGRIAEGFRKLR